MRGLRARTPGGRFGLAAAAALVLAAVSVAVLMPGLAGFASSGELTYRVFVPQTAKDAPGAPGVRVLPPAEGVYHSAFPDFGGEEDRVTAGAISSFTALAGKPIAWAYFSDNWFDGISFPAASARAAHDAGAIPFIRMMPRSTWDEEGPDPVYSLAAIAGGQFDDSLRQWARDAKAAGFPLMVEFGTEVNGDWFPWSGVYNGGAGLGPARFQAAYRHIIDIFRAEGVNNITWVFHVDAQRSPEAAWNSMSAYYPGDSYIDWLGLSAYGAQAPGEDWQTFSEVMDIGYPELAALSAVKPVAVLEFGVTEAGSPAAKAKWIGDAFAAVRSGRYPRVRAVSYWHENWEDDGVQSRLRIDSSAAALQAYRDAVAGPYFVSSVAVGPPP
ncbi:MAG: beta-mannanase [Dehalococcoidia bacterium]|nr:beta-mannanase [Dehalococcoidia bacterium]